MSYFDLLKKYRLPFFVIFLLTITIHSFAQHSADLFPVVDLCDLNLNRTATKLSSSELGDVSPAVIGYKWQSDDANTLKWRPQGITGINVGCKQFSVVSWYGREVDYPFPCNGQNTDYRNRGSRVSFVDISDMDDIKYRHVLLVDENYNTFYDMHAGGLTIVNDTLYAPDSRSSTDAMYAFPLDSIKSVPSADQSSFYNYGYILRKAINHPVDSLPINPSFVSYDWDDEQLVLGSFQNCETTTCSTPENNRLMWYDAGNVNPTFPFYDGLFGKMQGLGTATNLDNPNKKDVWVSTSYGNGNNSKLISFSYEFGTNTIQSQTVDVDNNYASITFPPGLEDIHLSPTNDTIWTLTEFSPDWPPCAANSSNKRYVFGFLRDGISPPGACTDEISLIQIYIEDTIICTPSDLVFPSFTNHISYANFDKSDDTWIAINDLRDTLSAINRSVFMWIKQTATVSDEPQSVLGINTATGGNISLLRVETNEKLGIYDGSNVHYGTTNITDGEWHHIGYTYDETTGETKIYVDGITETTFYDSQTIVPTALISIGQEFDSDLSKGNYLEGKITELTIWNEVLDAMDIDLLMSSTVKADHPKEEHLMAYYPMNKVCGNDLTIVDDISGNGFYGKAYGTIRSNGIAVQSLDILEQIPNFNSADHFNKDWVFNGSSISSVDTLVLVDGYNEGSYSLELTRNPFVITGDWNIDIHYNSAIDNLAALNSLTWIDGITYYTDNNTASYTLTNEQGCDSIITLNLDINPTLPIELLYFDAIVVNKNVHLKWSTLTEISNDYFITERSKNGRDWEQLDKINSNGNSNIEISYSAIDEYPFLGESYYRLKQIDFDGHYSYSAIKNVFIPSSEKSDIEIYPNPTNQQLTMISHHFEEFSILDIFDSQGRSVRGNIKITKLDNERIIVDLSNLNSGLFFIKTNNNTYKVYKK
jgi:hypothetical protein